MDLKFLTLLVLIVLVTLYFINEFKLLKLILVENLDNTNKLIKNKFHSFSGEIKELNTDLVNQTKKINKIHSQKITNMSNYFTESANDGNNMLNYLSDSKDFKIDLECSLPEKAGTLKDNVVRDNMNNMNNMNNMDNINDINDIDNISSTSDIISHNDNNQENQYNVNNRIMGEDRIIENEIMENEIMENEIMENKIMENKIMENKMMENEMKSDSHKSDSHKSDPHKSPDNDSISISSPSPSPSPSNASSNASSNALSNNMSRNIYNNKQKNTKIDMDRISGDDKMELNFIEMNSSKNNTVSKNDVSRNDVSKNVVSKNVVSKNIDVHDNTDTISLQSKARSIYDKISFGSSKSKGSKPKIEIGRPINENINSDKLDDNFELKDIEIYKMKELNEIANKLNINNYHFDKEKKRKLYKKEELYSKIKEEINKKSNQ